MEKNLTSIKSLQEETLRNLKNSKSQNTIRAYQSDFRDFEIFCNGNGFNSLPTEPKIIALYLTSLAKSSKFSTLKRRIASISVIHKMKGHYIDTKHPLIIENLLGIKRTIGSHQKSKKPLLINDLKLLINPLLEMEKEKVWINKSNNSMEVENWVKRKRNKALLLIGFAGGFRRSELVNIHYEDVEFVPEGVKIFIKRSKTDQSGQGMIKGIPYFDNKDYCPVNALQKWIDYINTNYKQTSGKIFPISDKGVALIIKKYALWVGLDPNKYAGHSLRSGFATSAAEAGAEERNIMAMTGHKTTQMVRRYIQEANLFKNNALSKIKL